MAVELVIDASVVVKWCLRSGEPRVEEALRLLESHLDQRSDCHILDLTPFEVGNALAGHDFDAEGLAGLLTPLNELDLGVITMTHDEGLNATCGIVRKHGLSFYDASYLAAAKLFEMPLVTDDYALLEAAKVEGLGIGLSDI